MSNKAVRSLFDAVRETVDGPMIDRFAEVPGDEARHWTIGFTCSEPRRKNDGQLHLVRTRDARQRTNARSLAIIFLVSLPRRRTRRGHYFLVRGVRRISRACQEGILGVV